MKNNRNLMKTTSYLWIAALLGALTLTGCKTASAGAKFAGRAPPATVTSTSSYLVTLVKSCSRDSSAWETSLSMN